MYDHSVRVPFIVVGPKVAKNHVIQEAIYLQDVMPTALELAGVSKPKHVEFSSLIPLLKGEPSRYQSIYGCYLKKQRSIRTTNYKLIAYPDANVLRLYDMQKDPSEKHDLAGDASMKSIVSELFSRLIALQDKMNDDLDLRAMAPQ